MLALDRVWLEPVSHSSLRLAAGHTNHLMFGFRGEFEQVMIACAAFPLLPDGNQLLTHGC